VTDHDVAAETMVDVAFSIAGTHLPRDHARPLARALVEQLPWLATEPLAGVHPIKLAGGGGGGGGGGDDACGLLPQRARLRLRVPGARVAALEALAGIRLDVDGCHLGLRALTVRDLLPHGTLFAPLVAADGPDELGFMLTVANSLRALQIDARSVCGLRGRIGAGAQPITGFSLMLHGLSAADSLRLQCGGLGPHRLLGCGIFVPHRSAAAVGA
jgi:CRISPR-associated protein Cas6